MKRQIYFTLLVMFVMPLMVFAQQEKNDNSTDSNELSLLMFKGTFKDKFIYLKWSPLSKPQNVKLYQVEYSQDGKNFKSIGKVYPDLINVYQYQSIIYHAGANYFRVIQVHQDGSSLVSYKINVMCGFPDRYILELNEEDNVFKMSFQVRSTQDLEAEVLDAKGQVQQELFDGEMMENEIIFRTIDASDWKKGTYYISLRGETFRENRAIQVKD